jgi:integrase
VPIPNRTKAALDAWSDRSGIAEGLIFRAVNEGGRVVGDGITPQEIHNIAADYAERLGNRGVAPHHLRRTFAKLAHKDGAALDQIQISPGHDSITDDGKLLGGGAGFVGLRLGS